MWGPLRRRVVARSMRLGKVRGTELGRWACREMRDSLGHGVDLVRMGVLHYGHGLGL